MKKYKLVALASILISCIFLTGKSNVVNAEETQEEREDREIERMFSIDWESDEKELTTQSSPQFNINKAFENEQPVYQNRVGSGNFIYYLEDIENGYVSPRARQTTLIYPKDGVDGISYKTVDEVKNIDKNPNNTLFKNGGAVNFIQYKNGKATGFKMRSLVTIFTKITHKQLDKIVSSGVSLKDRDVISGREPIGSLLDENGNTYAVRLNFGNNVPNSSGEYDVRIEYTGQGATSETAGKDVFIFEQDPTLIGDDVYPIVDKTDSNYFSGHEYKRKIQIIDDPVTKNSMVNYRFIFKDKYTGEIIGDSLQGTAQNGSPINLESAILPEGYKLDNSNRIQTVDGNNPIKIVRVLQDDKSEGYGNIKYDIVFKDKDTGEVLKDEQVGYGRPGQNISVQVPSGYELSYHSNMILKLSKMYPTKLVYVNKVGVNNNKYNYKINFVDKDSKKIVNTQSGQDIPNTNIRLIPPIGYTFDGISDNSFNLSKNNMTYTSYVDKADLAYNIQFVDSDNRTVGNQRGITNSNSIVKLTAPDGYEFVNLNDIYCKVGNNKVTKQITVRKLVYSDRQQTFNGVVSNYSDEGMMRVYTENGKLNTNIELSPDTSWLVDQIKEINGSKFYRIGPNEYINTSDTYRYIPIQKVIVTNNGGIKPVYNSKGNLIGNVSLAPNTAWYTDRTSMINGKMMYRVATDTWVGDYNVK